MYYQKTKEKNSRNAYNNMHYKKQFALHINFQTL